MNKSKIIKKKFGAFLMAIAMCLNGTAFAEEEFILHNGLKFGMTEEEAYNAEKSAGVILKNNRWTGTIAGQDNSSLFLLFDSTYSDGLYNVSYSFESITSYNAINSGLIAKYGETRFSSETGAYFIKPVLNKVDEQPYFAVNTYRDAQYSQWLVPYNDTQSILIHHYCYEQERTYYDYFRKLMVSKGHNADDYKDFLSEIHQISYVLLSEDETKAYIRKTAQYLNDL